ncbi:MAG: hypothetical protein WAV56_04540 [Microgenomates group bacterium]
MIQLCFDVGESGKRLLVKLQRSGGRLRFRNTKAARRLTEVGLVEVTEVGRVKVLSLLAVADEPLTQEAAKKLPL